MYIVRGYCAGILLFKSTVTKEELERFLLARKKDLHSKKYSITFALGVTQVAKEMCIDVYEKDSMQFRLDLSVAYKG